MTDPVLIAAFGGWNDAGEAASGALRHLVEAYEATCVADVDPEDFFDFQSHRPRVAITDGELDRPIAFPAVELWATPAGADRGLMLVRGVEPSLRWLTLCGDILDAAQAAGVTRVISLGALLADVPHTRPVRVSAMSSPRELTQAIGGRRPDYHGPTGIITLLHAMAVERGLASASLWAAVPHYVGGGASPTASLALLDAVTQITGVRPDLTRLERDVTAYREQIEEAVRANPQAEALISELEHDYDRAHEPAPGEIPTADAIAAEFERFLREQSPPDEPT